MTSRERRAPTSEPARFTAPGTGLVVFTAFALAGCASVSAPRSAPPIDAAGRAQTQVEPSASNPPESSGADRSASPFERPPLRIDPPLSATASLGRYDGQRDASLRLVIGGLDADAAGQPRRALASYQQAVRVDSTNPIAFLALARHHVAAGDPEEANAFLEQAKALFESQGEVGSAVDVYGLGLRAWIDRAQGRDSEADARFDAARQLSPEIWSDELLSAEELK